MPETLFQKVWNAHTVRTLPSGQTQLFVGLHLIHEVTSPQAFDMLRQHNWTVAFPERTFATVDHIVPTVRRQRPFFDLMAEEMTGALERNCRQFGISMYSAEDANQGIVHVIGPELGLTQPGMTVVCGDSHTATHGAFGALAFGIGTSEVEMVLATQCLLQRKSRTYEVRVDGALRPGVTAKDIILALIARIGVRPSSQPVDATPSATCSAGSSRRPIPLSLTTWPSYSSRGRWSAPPYALTPPE